MFTVVKRINYAAVLIFLMLLPFVSCTTTGVKPRFSCLRFAVLNNTAPESPFNGWPDKIRATVNDINYNSVDFVVHNGNAVYGGKSWMGIVESDMKRQYSSFLNDFRKLNAPFYTAAGEKDFFNGKLSVYSRALERKPFYSFNCGSVHCVVISDLSDKKNMITWLEKDLSQYKNSGGIIVYTYRSFFRRRNHRSLFGRDLDIHRVFKKYGVRLVVSGEAGFFIENDYEGIKYINAGCSGYHNKRYYRKYSHYYLFNVDEKSCSVKKMVVSH